MRINTSVHEKYTYTWPKSRNSPILRQAPCAGRPICVTAIISSRKKSHRCFVARTGHFQVSHTILGYPLVLVQHFGCTIRIRKEAIMVYNDTTGSSQHELALARRRSTHTQQTNNWCVLMREHDRPAGQLGWRPVPDQWQRFEWRSLWTCRTVVASILYSSLPTHPTPPHIQLQLCQMFSAGRTPQAQPWVHKWPTQVRWTRILSRAGRVQATATWVKVCSSYSVLGPCTLHAAKISVGCLVSAQPRLAGLIMAHGVDLQRISSPSEAHNWARQPWRNGHPMHVPDSRLILLKSQWRSYFASR